MPPPPAVAPQNSTQTATTPEDLAVGKLHPLPPHLQATLNPAQRKMRSKLGLIIFLLIGFFSVTIPVIGLPPIIFFLEYVGVFPHWVPRRFFDLCTANWITIITYLYENFYGIKIRTFGFNGNFKKRSLIIMNHISHLDWMYLWDVVDRQGQLSFWKAITKQVPMKDVPILGHCMQFSCFLFINRKWELDKLEFQKKLYYFNAIDYPIQLLLFPEGGDLTPKSRERSDNYAKANNLPCYSYCIHPHTTGFTYVMNALRDGGLDAVYDLTVAYPDILAKTELDAWKGFYPREVHFHVKSYDNKDIPEEQEGLKEWLNDRWLEKEERLKEYYTHKEFRDAVPQDHLHANGHVANDTKHDSWKSPEVFRPKNIPFLLYSIFIIVSTNAILIIPMLYVPHFWLYMVASFVFLVMQNRRGLSEFVMRPKQKEVERALKQSKYNTPANGVL